jgi:O-methyltransferase.
MLTEYNGEIWGHLDGALEGGIAFEALKGKPLFNWLHANPDEGARFQRMMFEVHSPETPAIVAAYDFSQFKQIVDVGGGTACCCRRSSPRIRTCAARCSICRKASTRPSAAPAARCRA